MDGRHFRPDATVLSHFHLPFVVCTDMDVAFPFVSTAMDGNGGIGDQFGSLSLVIRDEIDHTTFVVYGSFGGYFDWVSRRLEFDEFLDVALDLCLVGVAVDGDEEAVGMDVSFGGDSIHQSHGICTVDNVMCLGQSHLGFVWPGGG